MKLFKKSSSEPTRKTIRLDKKVFFIMVIVTPIFAAYTAVLTLTLIMQPWKDNSPIQVPVLGDVAEEKTEEKVEEKEETPVETPTETKEEEKPEEKTQESANLVKKSISFIQNKTQQTQNKTTNNTQNKTTQPTETRTEVKTEEKKEEKPAEPSAKELCEARTDGPKRLIKAHFLLDWEKEFYRNLGWENPVVDYDEYIFTNNGNAKMVYVNNACVPSKDGLIRDEEKSAILEEDQLATFGITAKKDYETWI